MTDHDQRWKTLLREFFEDFFRLFFPEWAELLDFSQVEWLDKEVFPDPPEGRRRVLDQVAKVGLAPEGRAAPGLGEELLALVHIEIESGDSAAPIHERMPRYYFHLREAHRAPVLPVVLFLRVGFEGIGIQEYVERFGPLETLRFRYLYVGLPALDGLQYVEGDNPLGVAMAALMRIPADRRAWFKAEALQHLGHMTLDDFRRYLLADCVDTYLPLHTEREREEFQGLLADEQYEEANTMTAPTIFQEGQLAILLLLLEERFGPLSETTRRRVEELPAEQLPELARKLLRAESLAELGLDS